MNLSRIFTAVILLYSSTAFAQLRGDSTSTEAPLYIGGYGSALFTQQINDSIYHKGKADVQRVVLVLDKKFNDRVRFFTELEFEHVNESFVEQAYLEYKFSDYAMVRSGLLLIPMGVTNLWHEDSKFSGVKRSYLNNSMIPTTWRELGVQVNGGIPEKGLRYELMIVNGLLGYDGGGKFGGSKPIRSGRQKGAESITARSFNLAGRVEYKSFSGLQLGLSGYFGESASTAYDGLEFSNNDGFKSADSTVVGMSILGFDAMYTNGRFNFETEAFMMNFSNTDQYNIYTGSDLGERLYGVQVEADYNLLDPAGKQSLRPFVRYTFLDFHDQVFDTDIKNDDYNKDVVTMGLSYSPDKRVMFKADYQIISDKNENVQNWLNFGIAFLW